MKLEHPTNRPNFCILTYHLGGRQIGLAFSYETLIGLWYSGRWYVAINEWGPTTGKHLNELDTRRPTFDRIPQSEVLDMALEVISGRAQANLTDLVTAAALAATAINRIGGDDEQRN